MKVLLFSFLVSFSAQAVNQQMLNQAIDKAINEKRIVGTVVIVAQKGEIIYKRAAGFADREANAPMKEDSIFRLSSLSKPITSLAVMSLVEKGILNLNDPVTKWIPDFRPKMANGYEPVITIHHLLTHTSGLYYSFFEPVEGPYHQARVSDGTDKVETSLYDNLLRLNDVPLLFPSGAAWLYSVGTDVLGEVVARAAGMTLVEAVRKLVTEPLDMKDTAFFTKELSRLTAPYINASPEPQRMVEGQLVPFAASNIVFSPSRATDENAYPSAGSSMVGTAMDYLKMLEEIRQNKGNVLSSETMNRITSVQTGDLEVSMAPGSGWSYAFAVVEDPSVAGYPKGSMFWLGAYGNSFLIDPVNEISMVIMTNTSLEGILGQFPKDINAAVYSK